MVVKIRLMRKGTRNRAFYRLVAADSRARRDGNILEELGWYNPVTTPKVTNVNRERISYWLSKGAQVSDGASLVLGTEGVISVAKTQGPARGVKRKKADKLTKAEKRTKAQTMVDAADAAPAVSA